MVTALKQKKIKRDRENNLAAFTCNMAYNNLQCTLVHAVTRHET